MRTCTSFRLFQSSPTAVPWYVCPCGYFRKESEERQNSVLIRETIDTETSEVLVERNSCVDFYACKKAALISSQ